MPYLLLACGVGILFFALIQLLAGSSQPLRNMIVFNCFTISYMMFYLWAAATGMLVRLPALANSDIALRYPTVMSFYLAALTILHEGRRPVQSYAAYYLAPVLLAACSGLYSVLISPLFLRMHGALPGHYSDPLFMTLTIIGDLSFMCSCILNLLAARRLFLARKIQDRAGFRHQVVILFAYLASSIFLVVSSALRNEGLYTAACLMVGIIVVFYALTRSAAFYFSPDLRPPRLRQRMPQWDSSASDLDTRLASLMEREAPYRDETLSLRHLAGMLGVEPKRLSYHLNLQHSKSFRSYINELRLEAVCRELMADPRCTILDTAFANGFNSKSSFNDLFYKKYGLTPKEFRRTNLDRPDVGSLEAGRSS
jgi:AraC-like DNA-binding protein